jgi:hypothetical protein
LVFSGVMTLGRDIEPAIQATAETRRRREKHG